MSPPSRRLQTKPVITCLKTFLISYSLIFWFTGVILLAVGVWGKVSLESYLLLASDVSTNAPYVLIGTGAIIVIFGLFGCFATCRGSPWMLKLYAMFLILVFLAELVAGISGFVFRHEGCFSLVTTVMESNLGIIAGISFGIAFFQRGNMRSPMKYTTKGSHNVLEPSFILEETLSYILRVSPR
ncbi:tetraspanin-6, partial [Clarias magur]